MPDREIVIGHLNDCLEAARRHNASWVYSRVDIIADAIALLKELSDRINKLEDANAYLENAMLDDQTEIVRCKDCLFWRGNNNGYPHPECRWCNEETPDEDDYCSYAVDRRQITGGEQNG